MLSKRGGGHQQLSLPDPPVSSICWRRSPFGKSLRNPGANTRLTSLPVGSRYEIAPLLFPEQSENSSGPLAEVVPGWPRQVRPNEVSRCTQVLFEAVHGSTVSAGLTPLSWPVGLTRTPMLCRWAAEVAADAGSVLAAMARVAPSAETAIPIMRKLILVTARPTQSMSHDSDRCRPIDVLAVSEPDLSRI